MFRKTWLPLIALGGLTAILPPMTPCTAAQATQQTQTEQASTSRLTGLPLPADTVRLRDSAVPDGVKEGLRSMAQAAGPHVRQGRTEVLVWNDAAAKTAKSRMGTALQGSGWQLTENGPITDRRGQGQQRLTLRCVGPPARALTGFWADNGETLVLAWTEVLAEADSHPAAPSMAGGRRVQTPGQPPTPTGLLSLRESGDSLTGTFTPPGKPAVPLQGVQASDKRLSFRFTLTGQGKALRTFQGLFTPTLDADAWTGRLTGPNGGLDVDLVRRR